MPRTMRTDGVKVVVSKQFEAIDGKVFDTVEEAAAHSAKDAYKGLYRMNDANIDAILRGEDKPREALILKLARRIDKAIKADPNYVPKRRAKKTEDSGAVEEFTADA